MRGSEKEEDERKREKGGGEGGVVSDGSGSPAGVGLRWRGRARPCGWWRLDLLLDRDLLGGWRTSSNL